MPTKKASKKISKKSAGRSAAGKAATEKGRKFEDAVADLYRLLGAQVTQNIEIHQKKVDILATFRVPGSPREYRVIVECKDEQKAVNANQRVQAFKGLLGVARLSGEADAAEIITRVPWSDQAKGFAKTAGIDLLTYTEKIAQLIDFTGYLKQLVSKFDNGDPGRPGEPSLGKYYIDLSAQRIKSPKADSIKVIDTYINQWLRANTKGRQLAVFGEYGSGKSSLCQKLARDLADSYLRDPGAGRIPILLNLRDFIGKVKIDAYITSFLDQECHVPNPKFDLFRAMNEAGMFLLIFDGFDEMAVKVDADTLESNLMEIDKLAAQANSKVILTSRPEYFVNIEEEQQVISPSLNVFGNRAAEYEPLRILPWNEDQVERFLEKRVPLVKEAQESWTFYRDRIKGIPSLSDLSQRPVLLDMIVKTLPRLIQENIPINLPNLYKTYLSGEIKRQRISKKREFLLTEKVRLDLLKNLAVDIYSNVISKLTFTDALNLIERQIKPPKNEQEAYTREFLTNSFLIRKGDDYHFSHKSIMEYLVALKCSEEIETNTPDAFKRVLLRRVITNFLIELEPNPDTLLSWINSTKGEESDPSVFIGGNAATLLCAISKDALAGKDLSGATLRMAHLTSANLIGTDLRGTVLDRVDLRYARFTEDNLAKAKMSQVLISVGVLVNSPARPGRKGRRPLGHRNIIRLIVDSPDIRHIQSSYRVDMNQIEHELLGFVIKDLKSIRFIRNSARKHNIASAIYDEEFGRMPVDFKPLKEWVSRSSPFEIEDLFGPAVHRFG